MMYVEFSAGNKDYKLRLNTRNVVALEKQLGCNPLSIFISADGEVPMPTISQMVVILHASLQQYNHGITMNDAYEIFDDWIADGHSTVEFVSVILDIYKESGLVPKEVATTEGVAKN